MHLFSWSCDQVYFQIQIFFKENLKQSELLQSVLIK